MAIAGISTKFVKALSGLGNNSDSIVPMAVKDTISNCAIVDTYRKEGGPDDARERGIEEFGTGIVWLFGIPTLKKAIDKFVYPKFGLNAKLDPRILKDEESMNMVKTAIQNGTISEAEKGVFTTLKDNNKIFKNLTNEKVYKGMFVGKFLAATGLSAVLLSKIIQYKQKTTQERIERDLQKNTLSSLMLSKSVNDNQTFKVFTDKKVNKKDNIAQNKSSQPSFTGNPLSFFMYNPIGNTSILDGVITGTRLKEARHGERKEVALKEAFQIVFIYFLAKPIEKMFELMGKAIKAPIGCDPMVIFDKSLKEDLTSSKGAIDTLLASKNAKEELYKLNPKHSLIKLLENNGTISTVKNKEGASEAISMLGFLKESDLRKSLEDLKELSAKTDNLKAIKAFKIFAVLGNVALAAWAMGVLQPKVNIFMRKALNNGDNRNPAIVAQEKMMKEKMLNGETKSEAKDETKPEVKDKA